MKRISLILMIFLLIPIAYAINNELSLNLQTTNSDGSTQTGTFVLQFDIATDIGCTNIIYTSTQTLTTDSRGILNVNLTGISFNFSEPSHYLCYYRDSVLKETIKIASVPYAFRSNITDSVDSRALQPDGWLFISSGLVNLNTTKLATTINTTYTNGTGLSLIGTTFNFSTSFGDTRYYTQTLADTKFYYYQGMDAENITGGTLNNARLSLDDAAIPNDITVQTSNNLLVNGGYDSGGITLYTNGDLKLSNDLWVNGDIYRFGTAYSINATNLNTNASLIPTFNKTFDLGNTSHWWNNGYIETVYSGLIDTTDITVNGINVALHSGISGENITSGIVADVYIASTIARDNEIINNCSVDHSCPNVVYITDKLGNTTLEIQNAVWLSGIGYHNLTGLPTCSGTDVLTYDGIDFSCIVQSGGGGTGYNSTSINTTIFQDIGGLLSLNKTGWETTLVKIVNLATLMDNTTIIRNYNKLGNTTAEIWGVIDNSTFLKILEVSSIIDNSSIIRSYNTSWITKNQLVNTTADITNAMTNTYPNLDTDSTDDLTLTVLDNTTIIRNYNTSWITNNQYYGVNHTTQFGGEVSGTYGAIVLDNNALDDQYYELTDKVGNTTAEIAGVKVANATHADTVSSYTETDPIYSAWDKSTGISITESQISDLQSYLTSESDPIWIANRPDYLNITTGYTQLQIENSTIVRNYQKLGNTTQEIWDVIDNNTYGKLYNATFTNLKVINSPAECLAGTKMVYTNMSYSVCTTDLTNTTTDIQNVINSNKLGNTTAEIIQSATGKVNSTSWNRTNSNVILANSGDNVGIGVTAPNYLLTVADTTGAGLSMNVSDVLFVNGSSGNVGIGTTDPTTNLHISGATSPFIRVIDTTNTADMWLQSTDSVGYVGTNSNHRFTLIASGVEVMSLLGTGNVGIGNTNPLVKLDVEGTAECDGAGCWAVESDLSLKKNVVDSKYGLNELMRIKPRDYTLKETNESSFGFIAQELKPIIPEIVRGEEGNMSIGYGGLVPVLVKAIQEQQAEINSLKSRISKIEAMLNITSK